MIPAATLCLGLLWLFMVFGISIINLSVVLFYLAM